MSVWFGEPQNACLPVKVIERHDWPGDVERWIQGVGDIVDQIVAGESMRSRSPLAYVERNRRLWRFIRNDHKAIKTCMRVGICLRPMVVHCKGEQTEHGDVKGDVPPRIEPAITVLFLE